MYKVNVTVFKDPTGKTMKGPSFLHFLGTVCWAAALISLLGGIAFMMDGKLGPAQIAGHAAVIAAGAILGVAAQKKAKRQAQLIYMKVLAELARQEEQGQR